MEPNFVHTRTNFDVAELGKYQNRVEYFWIVIVVYAHKYKSTAKRVLIQYTCVFSNYSLPMWLLQIAPVDFKWDFIKCYYCLL